MLRTGYSKVAGKKGLDWKERRSPCAENLLRLRLRRTGTTLHYSWAPGAAGDSFVEVHEQEFGDDDIANVRLFAMNGQQPCQVDVRLIDVRIRSGQAAGLVPATQATELITWLPALLLGAVTVVLLALAGWLYLRQRRRAVAALSPAPRSINQAEVPVASVSVAIQCSGCGKNLKVKSELAGKKVKMCQLRYGGGHSAF